MKKFLAFGVGFLASLSAIFFAYHQSFGATSIVPYQILGRPLFDTPSGNLDVGFYYLASSGPIAHLAAQPLAVPITGSTTITMQPDGLYGVAAGVLAHIIGTRYVGLDKQGIVIGVSDDQTIGNKLRTKGAVFPSLPATTSQDTLQSP